MGRCGDPSLDFSAKISIFMFQGHATCNLDVKSRLMIPAKFRKYMKPEADNKLILTRGMENCVLVYPQDEWEKVKIALSGYNSFNKDQRFFIREFFMYVNECELDSQNRILIPPQLKEYAQLDKEVVMLGLMDKMEIWNPKLKDEYDKSQTQSYEEIAEKVSEIITANNNGGIST